MRHLLTLIGEAIGFVLGLAGLLSLVLAAHVVLHG